MGIYPPSLMASSVARTLDPDTHFVRAGRQLRLNDSIHRNPKMLDIKDLRATVADKEILKGITLTVNAGEVHAVMGPAGDGR